VAIVDLCRLFFFPPTVGQLASSDAGMLTAVNYPGEQDKHPNISLLPILLFSDILNRIFTSGYDGK
jgi:hypothetical protein